MDIKNVVIYIRRANDENNASMRDEKKLKRYCNQKRYNIEKIFKDINCSGHDFNPQLLELMDYVSKNEVYKVIIKNPAVISRGIEKCVEFYDCLIKNNCGVEFVNRTNNKNQQEVYSIVKQFGNSTTAIELIRDICQA